MKMISLLELSPAERQAWVGRMLRAEELGAKDDYDIPEYKWPRKESHYFRKVLREFKPTKKKCTFCEVLTWSYVVGAVFGLIVYLVLS